MDTVSVSLSSGEAQTPDRGLCLKSGGKRICRKGKCKRFPTLFKYLPAAFSRTDNRIKEGGALPSTPAGRRSPSGGKIPFGAPAIADMKKYFPHSKTVPISIKNRSGNIPHAEAADHFVGNNCQLSICLFPTLYQPEQFFSGNSPFFEIGNPHS